MPANVENELEHLHDTPVCTNAACAGVAAHAYRQDSIVTAEPEMPACDPDGSDERQLCKSSVWFCANTSTLGCALHLTLLSM